MKIITFLFAVFFGISVSNAQRNPFVELKNSRIEKVINTQWTFNYFSDEAADKGYESSGFNDSEWPVVSLPHTWNTYETTGELHPFINNIFENDNPYWWKGWGWYRKHFSINPEYSGRKVFIEFEGIQKDCKVWLNGKYLGDHKGGYGSFDFDITSLINNSGDNVIAVAVSNRQNEIYKIPPVSEGYFNGYGGIYRDVRLVIRNNLYIPMQGAASHEGGTFITTPEVSDKEGVVRVQTWVKNDYPQKKKCTLITYVTDAGDKLLQTIKSEAEIAPGQLYMFDQTGKPVKDPHLWSVEDPYLYNVYSEVLDGKQIADSYTSPLGFRWFRWDFNDNILYVNNSKIVVKAGYRQQEYPWLGVAIPKWITALDYLNISENIGCNFMRTADYPDDRLVYDLTDKYGIIIDEESPGSGENDASPDVQEQKIKEMIRRDRNHPSVFFWSIGSITNNIEISKYAIAEDTTRILTTHSDKNGTAVSLLKHNDENFKGIIFRDLTGENGTLQKDTVKNIQGNSKPVVNSEVPAKIVLAGSHQKIEADRGSVAIITANVADAKGNIVTGASNIVKWTVTGPAILVGPSVYENVIDKLDPMQAKWYKGMPASNVIRSTGEPGKISVRVAASGLASGSFDLIAEEIIPDNSVIIEPVLTDDGRSPVTRITLTVNRLDDIPRGIKFINDDLILNAPDKQAYAGLIRDFIYKNNPLSDSSSVEFNTLVNLLSTQLYNNNGHISAGDYNYNADHFNNCRLICSYIISTKLPPLFKEELKKYYANEIIMRGSEKNAGEEMNWLNWIPSGGMVVFCGDSPDTPAPKGVKVTGKYNLEDIITEVYPGFKKFSIYGRERALTFISKMNPYIEVSSVSARSADGEKDKATTIFYTAEKGKMILIPDLKFIAE